MMTLFDFINENKENDFYPTPAELANKMLYGVDLGTIGTVLEPSAGKGDLLRELAKKEIHCFDVDCIEIDSNLRTILNHNFSDERERSISNEIHELYNKSYVHGEGYSISNLSEKEQARYAYLKEEESNFFERGIHIVGDDFLKYETDKQYDLIFMNPPFSEGDKHLLKALEMQKNGGNIICLLNAETIRNPYTNTRKLLIQKLNEYGANIEYVENSFSAAERRTNVEVAIIKVAIPKKVFDSEFLNRFIEAEKYEEIQLDNTELALTDYIKAAIAQYKVECKAGVALIKEYEALKPYVLNSLEKSEGNYDYRQPIIELKINGKDRGSKINEYLKSVRYKYWYALLHNKKYIGKLTKELRQKYYTMVDRLQHYEFSEFNIYSLSTEINSKIKVGIEEEIVVMFDRLTAKHTWYDETGKNIHYFNGWKTNKAHKIGNKVILPVNGFTASYWKGDVKKPDSYRAYDGLVDLEKILNYFDGQMCADVNLSYALDTAFNAGITKNINCKFFSVTFYKKGTCHIKFHDSDRVRELIDRFNIYACQRKEWLPPSYGKKTYTNMTSEEKAVIDSFQGEKEYEKVLARKDYFLSSPVKNQTLMLDEAIA